MPGEGEYPRLGEWSKRIVSVRFLGGRCAVLSPGQYPQLTQLEYRVSSLRQLR